MKRNKVGTESYTNSNDLSKEVIKMREAIEKALARIRPALQADGGDVELIEITDDGIVRVKLLGACGGCPMSTMTLKNGIQRFLKQEIPQVKEVEAI